MRCQSTSSHGARRRLTLTLWSKHRQSRVTTKWWEKQPQWNRRVKHDLRWKRHRGYGTQGTLRVRSELLFQSSCCIKIGSGRHHCASALATRLRGMGDCTRHQYVVISVHWVLRTRCWLPWLYGEGVVWLSVPGLLRNWQIWYCTAIQDTANLTELAYSRLKVNNPLGWDVLDALKLLSGLL